HLFERVHRRGDGQLLARHRAGACRRARPGERRRSAAGALAAAADAQEQGAAQSARLIERYRVPPAVQAALLGIVQGVTEFLPVSSTAHLLIAERLIGYNDAGGVFRVMIQLGSILAVLWLYLDMHLK